jgi:hypothetical protein
VSAPVARAKRGRPQRVSDETIVEMLGMAASVAAAARALGYTPGGLRGRAMKSESVASAIASMGKRDVPPPRSQTRVADADVVRGLDAAPSVCEGAAALGYTHQALYIRARTSPEIRAALARAAARSAAARGTVRALATEAIRAALNASLTLGEAAKSLGVGHDAFCAQVAARGLAAELDAMKERFRMARRACSDEDLVGAFRQHGSITAAARALGVHVQTIYKRLREPATVAAVAPYRRDGRARSEAA